MVLPQHGGCLCGEIRYRLDWDPLTLYACHCSDCQRQSGASFGLSMVIQRDALEVLQGEPQEFSLEMPDGRRKHGRFCGRCAARIWGEPARFPGLANLRPGTLDDTSWLRPIAHIWTRSAQPWVEIPGDTLTFAGQPEGDDVADLVRAWRERKA